MEYTVKYKLPSQWFWRTVRKVKGDGLQPETQARYLILTDETRLEIPLPATFKFSPARFALVKAQLDRESGGSIRVE